MASILDTFICDYDGGTYLAQTLASVLHSALMNWARDFSVEEITSDISLEIAKSAFEVRDANELDITPINGLIGVWCWTTVVADELAHLTIVQSSGRSRLPSPNRAERPH